MVFRDRYRSSQFGLYRRISTLDSQPAARSTNTESTWVTPTPSRARFAWAVLLPLDIGSMRSAAEVLVGRHDFKAFSAFNGADPEEGADTFETCGA